MLSRRPCRPRRTWPQSGLRVGLWECPLRLDTAHARGPDSDDTFLEGSCTDSAGNTTLAIHILKYDATAPVLNPTVSPNPVTLGQPATATPNATDNLSTVVSQGCQAVDTSQTGTHTVTCTATDVANNTAVASASYQVVFAFGGFLDPISSSAPNEAKAGQSIPIKWRLTDYNGDPVDDPESFVSVTSTVTPGQCGGSADAIEDYTSGSGLQYLGDGYWQFNWKTPKSYAGQCRTMSLNLRDGAAHAAEFTFK